MLKQARACVLLGPQRGDQGDPVELWVPRAAGQCSFTAQLFPGTLDVIHRPPDQASSHPEESREQVQVCLKALAGTPTALAMPSPLPPLSLSAPNPDFWPGLFKSIYLGS